MTRETKSPIKNLPVRLPGQSIDERIDQVAMDRILEPFLIAAVLCVLALMEWIRYFLHTKPAPALYTGIAVVGILWAFWRMRPALRQLRDLRLGRTGERAVGQYLEEQLRPAGFHVLHDIAGKGFNLDHVVVGPTGVFCVETKTRSKPARGAASIQYDGEKITVDGLAPDRDPVVQIKASAKWLCELLESSTGKRFFVQPVVLFPGWYIEKMPANSEVWVLNDKATPSFIRGAKTHIAAEDASLITFHLKRYVIATAQAS